MNHVLWKRFSLLLLVAFTLLLIGCHKARTGATGCRRRHHRHRHRRHQPLL